MFCIVMFIFSENLFYEVVVCHSVLIDVTNLRLQARVHNTH